MAELTQPPTPVRTLRELILEAIDADAPISTPMHDGAISSARLKQRPVRHTELTLGVATNLLSVNDLFNWINGGEIPAFVPYIVWIPRAVHERTAVHAIAVRTSTDPATAPDATSATGQAVVVVDTRGSGPDGHSRRERQSER